MRQKDLLPSERDEIVTEMFKRVRPLLEKKIAEASRKQAEDRKAREGGKGGLKKERDFVRAERQRTHGASWRRHAGPTAFSAPAEILLTGDRACRHVAADRRRCRQPHGGELAAECA